jgi:hypothetical protein
LGITNSPLEAVTVGHITLEQFDPVSDFGDVAKVGTGAGSAYQAKDFVSLLKKEFR